MQPKDVRVAAGKSRSWCAAMANVSEATARAFELGGPTAVCDRARVGLERVYSALEAGLADASEAR